MIVCYDFQNRLVIATYLGQNEDECLSLGRTGFLFGVVLSKSHVCLYTIYVEGVGDDNLQAFGEKCLSEFP